MDCSKHPKAAAVFGLLLAAVLLALAAWLGLKARNEARQYKFIGVPVESHVISVTGEAKIATVPDIAAIDLGTTIERSSVAAAQQENTRIMNALNAKLKDFGVESKDLQTTNYTIYPAYDWNNGKQTLRGYTVSQSLHVKIRQLDKVGDIIGAAGELGANQVGGINFTIDNPDKIRAEARLQALQVAKEKAGALAKVAGVTLRRVVSFQESGDAPQPVPMYAYKAEAVGMGGGGPSVEAGSTEVVVDVTVTYEIE